jgi:hypothetical protein
MLNRRGPKQPNLSAFVEVLVKTGFPSKEFAGNLGVSNVVGNTDPSILNGPDQGKSLLYNQKSRNKLIAILFKGRKEKKTSC